MNKSENDLLHSMSNRLGRVEERMQDLSEIKARLEKIQESLSSLKIRVAGVAAAVTIFISLFFKFLELR